MNKRKELLAAGLVKDYRFINKEEYELYIYDLDHKKMRYQILEKVTRENGVILLRISLDTTKRRSFSFMKTKKGGEHMASKLYYKAGEEYFLVGTFRNREKAQRFWDALKDSLAAKLGMKVTPIYIETGKGRGK